jgi:hypothetical protein
MRRLLVALVALAAGGCASWPKLTPAQKEAAVRTAIDGGRVGCFTALKDSVALTPAQAAWCQCRTP